MFNEYNHVFSNDICNDINITINNMVELTYVMDSCNTKTQPISIYIAGLLEKLTKEMIIEKYYDEEIGEHILIIDTPNWFKSIEPNYKKTLYKLIRPHIEMYLKQN